ncbi:MAG: magnesium transporter CorA family protein [Chitinophagales bacterium]|nr:magnesium transporter CorA family protein [Chitinophagales bacterium]HAE13771.1 magnesium transporter CorA [Bacteroidota bacterium]MCB9020303.1 magnesium transporter CorA family protein [Chitinophagales bacterium]MCB9022346.1 magnesium transporter CorA family protein [Chitinophagales bacterium]HPE97521.1 magnesium transporter CorA family protein [Chitinophagales bacterium]
MIKYYKREQNNIVEIDRPEKDCWINVYPPFDHKRLAQLSDAIDIPIDFLLDSIDINERSRFEVDDNVKLIVINTPIENDLEHSVDNEAFYITVPIGIILTKDHNIIISSAQNRVIDWLFSVAIKHLDPADKDTVVLKIFEKNVFYFTQYLNEMNKRRYLIEKELMHSSRNTELSKLLNIQKSLVYFVTDLRANELLMMKMARTNIVLGIKDDEEKSDYLQDILIDSGQASEMANVYTNILNGTMDAFGSIISNNLNMVMKRLTSVTIILMVPTLIASFYGMNLSPLPLAGEGNAFWYILFISLVSAGVLYWVFRRIRWF